MPRPVQIFTYIIPARYFIEVSRGVMLKGSGFIDLWGDFAALSIFAVVFIAAATLRIRIKGLM
jgi:ABC-2 type transport system permease protein